MFIERLQQVCDRIPDCRVLSLVARDGIPVETVPSEPEHDVELLAAELMSQIRDIDQNHRDLAVGTIRQLTVGTDTTTLMVSAVSDEYYLLLVMGAEGNRGRARFELRRAALAFENDLG